MSDPGDEAQLTSSQRPKLVTSQAAVELLDRSHRRGYGPRVSKHQEEIDAAPTRQRLTTVFGWVAGGSTGVLANWGLFVAVGEGYPVTWTTFVLFLVGAFAGMFVADKLGPRGFRPLGIAAGVLFAVFVAVLLTVTTGGPTP